MNAESSRSHLILGIIIESTNLTSGAVVKGKVCLSPGVRKLFSNYSLKNKFHATAVVTVLP